VCASVNLPLHHKVEKFSSGSSGWSRKKGRKTVVCVCVAALFFNMIRNMNRLIDNSVTECDLLIGLYTFKPVCIDSAQLSLV